MAAEVGSMSTSQTQTDVRRVPSVGVVLCHLQKFPLETIGWPQRVKVEHEEGEAGGAGVL